MYGGAFCVAVQPYLWSQSFFLATSSAASGVTAASNLSVMFDDVNVSDSRASTRSVSGPNTALVKLCFFVILIRWLLQMSKAELRHSAPM